VCSSPDRLIPAFTTRGGNTREKLEHGQKLAGFRQRAPEDPAGCRRIGGIPDHPQSPTALLLAWGQGDQAAFDQLMPLVHDELRRLARRQMGHERQGHTLQATALVNEAYLRLIDMNRMRWQNRAHFFAMSARIMRRILVDAARAKGYQKRGGGAQRVTLDDALVVTDEPDQDLVALDDALQALAALDPRKGQVVEMRFFGGLSVEGDARLAAGKGVAAAGAARIGTR
jgi:RNA polymerase sigma-70 factor (ECF subfamily)